MALAAWLPLSQVYRPLMAAVRRSHSHSFPSLGCIDEFELTRTDVIARGWFLDPRGKKLSGVEIEIDGVRAADVHIECETSADIEAAYPAYRGTKHARVKLTCTHRGPTANLASIRPVFNGIPGRRFFRLRSTDLPEPSAVLQEEVGGGGMAVAFGFLSYFDFLGLEKASRILDVGCGYGRMALGLRHLLDSGTYDGIDIMPHHISWAQENISTSDARFQFHHVDLFNAYYNPSGRLKSEIFSFPFEDASFDFVLLTSVFTHVFAPTAKNYLREISRVLKPGGRCFATCFLLNDESIHLQQSGEALKVFPHQIDPETWIADPEKPEGAVAFLESHFFAWAKAWGLQPRTLWPGGWVKRLRSVDFQDILIFEKPAR